MKRCPTCQKTYPDDQNFCFDDGTTLSSAPLGSFDSSDAPTANYPFRGSSSAPTEIMHGTPTTSGRPPIQTSPPPAFMTPYPQQKRSSAVPWIVGAAVVLIIGIVVAVFLASRNSGAGAGTTGTTGTSSSSSTSNTSGTTTTTSSSSSSSSSWESVSGDGFTISMPGTPATNEDTIPSAAGPLLLRMYTLTKGYEGFITGYTEYPDIVFSSAEPEKLLDGAQQGAISNVKGEVTNQRSITIDGHPGREIVGVSPAQNVGFTARVYLVKPRMYMLVYTQFDKEKPISADGQKFLDSFQLTN